MGVRRPMGSQGKPGPANGVTRRLPGPAPRPAPVGHAPLCNPLVRDKGRFSGRAYVFTGFSKFITLVFNVSFGWGRLFLLSHLFYEIKKTIFNYREHRYLYQGGDVWMI